ncbi:hypothetical protein Dalk_1206 [Desulfatibacillum aliphaticivorans]|uniref:NTF2 fold domain-containing protein n=1 Tax=Desulfatibacillum aliphaticivorans TaxID=218208 RepID=B8F9G3_DESAL|nr:YbbC/YhhH family protein [Desulfatibacillum aliphaticivorans]ACL02909.1 hypothetical protein Dalk_1206 [Desulfatibacillum aliphaticivorans]
MTKIVCIFQNITLERICFILLTAIFLLAPIPGRPDEIDHFSADTVEDIENIKDLDFVPENGYVPDEETAIRIAEAVWLPIYGPQIYQDKPFVAKLYGDEWLVKGTYVIPDDLNEIMRGGVPYAVIRKIDGKILAVTHTR